MQPKDVLILAPHRPGTLGFQDGQALGPWTLNTVADFWEEDKADHVRMGTVFLLPGALSAAKAWGTAAKAEPEEIEALHQ